MMKIGVDAMGGDFAPLESVKGAVTAARIHPEFKVVLFGDKSAIKRLHSGEPGFICF